jgi:hypothetical protein
MNLALAEELPTSAETIREFVQRWAFEATTDATAPAAPMP